MATAEHLTIKDGYVGCVMLVVTAGNDEMQWFEFVPSYFAPLVRIEWEPDIMSVLLPTADAELLVKKGYARHMTASEARAYNESFEKEKQKETNE